MRQQTKDTIDNYVSKRWRPGSFVTAVLANDLMQAFACADEDNAENMHSIVKYVYNHTPNICHGSYEIVDNWLKKEKNE
jgi:hypothetical protein